jgi:FKBP-type peptidyl-prolyl cis-trans isomerase FkpA
MKRSIYFLGLAMITLMVSCNTDFKKTKSGVVYKIFHRGKSSDPVAKNGDILKFHITEKLNDSLLGSSYGKMPGYAQVTVPVTQPYSPLEIFPMLRKGDSAVVVLSMDTLMKSGIAQMNFPNAKKGDKLTLTYKILDIFHEDSTVRADINIEQTKDAPRRQKEMEEQQRKTEAEMITKKIDETKEIEAYLSSQNIKAIKTDKGTFIQILDPGNGPQADSGKYVTFDYTGKTFAGKVFDSSIDTTFHHNAISYVTGGGMYEGVDDGIRHLKKGAHALLYIPGVMANGQQAISQDVGPFTNMIFDIYIRDVKESPPSVKPPTGNDRQNKN